MKGYSSTEIRPRRASSAQTASRKSGGNGLKLTGSRGRGRRILNTLGPLLAATLTAAGLSAGDEHSPRAIIDRVDRVLRGASSRGVATMSVVTRHWERSLTMEVWSLGSDYSLVRVLSPAKEAGTGTLKASRDIWNYLPKVDRTIKIPASMMMGSWMGSHFTNDDLVKESRLVEDYEIETTFDGTRGTVRGLGICPDSQARSCRGLGKDRLPGSAEGLHASAGTLLRRRGRVGPDPHFQQLPAYGRPPDSGPHGHATSRQTRRADHRELRRTAIRPGHRQVFLLTTDAPAREVSGHGSSFLVADRLAQSGRNPRRTFITALGLAASYFAVIFMVGFADGLKVELIDNGTSLMTGQIQIHSPRYRPDRSLYETLGGRRGADFEAMIRTAIRDPEVVAAAPRVYGAGLVSSGQATTAGMLMGIDPAREPGVSRLMESLWKGRAPAPATGELMIGAEMARQLELQVGDEVILVAPAADGSMGNDIFRVCGLYRTGMADLDGAFALLPIESLQRLLALDPGRIHEIALSTADPWLAPEAGRRLGASLAPLGVELEVLDWTGLRPEMLEYAMLMDSWYSIVVLIVFAIALFGVANTMLMSTFERRREFSVMLALGARPHQILLTVVSEAAALGWISLALGLAITFPLIAWWHHSPIDLSWIYGDFTMLGALIRPVLRIEYNLPMSLWTALALLLTAVTAGLYPAARAAWLPPADTLSGL